jgi:hypothetical protein
MHVRVQVLSVETALSIQSHPDKALALKLHASRPDVRFLPFEPATLSQNRALQRSNIL